MQNRLQEIYRLKEELDANRPLGHTEAKLLRENYVTRNTYNSNAIEGNTLTEMETRVIIETGLTIEKKSLREHLEVQNHVEALNFVEELVNDELSERDIKDIHAIILQGIDRKNAGVYRRADVATVGATHGVSPYHAVHGDMQGLISWYQGSDKDIDTIIEMVCKFINIHPFIDGNGRTSRLVMNLELMKIGFPPIIVLAENRLEYFKALDESYYGRYDLAKELFYDCILIALKEHLAIIGKSM